MLKGELRTLVNFKNNYEFQVSIDATKGKTAESKKMLMMQEEIKLLKRQIQDNTTTKTETEKLIKAKEDSCSELVTNAKMSLEALKEDNEKLVQHIQKLQNEINDDKEMMTEMKKVIQQQQLKLLKITQLDSQLHSMKAQHHADVQQISNAQRQEELEKERVQRLCFQLEVDKDRLVQELDQVKVELQSYKTDYARTQLQFANEKLERTTAMVGVRDKKIAVLKMELRKSQLGNEVLLKKIRELKSEYDRLFDAVVAEKEKEREKRKLSFSSASPFSAGDGTALLSFTNRLNTSSFSLSASTSSTCSPSPSHSPSASPSPRASVHLSPYSSVNFSSSLQASSSPLSVLKKLSEDPSASSSSSSAASTSPFSGASRSYSAMSGQNVMSSSSLSDLSLDTGEGKVLRKIIALQEERISALTQQTRRMLAKERRSHVEEERRKTERARYESELAALKMQIKSLTEESEWGERPSSSSSSFSGGGVKMSSEQGEDGFSDASIKEKAMNATVADIERLMRRNRELEQNTRDYKNVKSANESLAQGYERLLKSSASSSTSPEPSGYSPPSAQTRTNMTSRTLTRRGSSALTSSGFRPSSSTSSSSPFSSALKSTSRSISTASSGQLKSRLYQPQLSATQTDPLAKSTSSTSTRPSTSLGFSTPSQKPLFYPRPKSSASRTHLM
ncbi:uncharacterized protein MONOS_14593 [Monocercomonoides exilis]|uniref:uncharacterized protein n=1 Tax=Monocercomonoides exilis TaxID=2049356 RepID=UPI00355A6882|nr:hypothetical protein MONOS_14593 [Monocercomonoides exilis]|eukprot:MONOS_14593.1-p1 / transcript=MONOS_14593.1 / gene=MONOS_14593 / organism=Monocercomonoides_exilis_PA203 / gene_product=unspecified product / transcript_product=unspecified product / location=Mono_scaffold01030:13027-16071(+) / protein_length=677 / sequence_SO=supercontig / SO=protein_coding / is_pseudo=false